ncbi:MAG: hypothetical protein V1722_04460 [Candidatus Micrarchaeota archaeon]
MLALQLATITTVIAIALLAAHVNAANSLTDTKITLLQSQNNEFQEKMYSELISQALDSNGVNCEEKQTNAALALNAVVAILDARQIEIQITSNNSLEINEITSELFSCVGEKISIGNAERNIILKLATPTTIFAIGKKTQKYKGENEK